MAQHYGYAPIKDGLLKRLTRVEGQVRGISRMVAEDRYCIDILTQLGAIESALDKVALELVREHTKHCLADASLNQEQRVAKADELSAAVARLLSK